MLISSPHKDSSPGYPWYRESALCYVREIPPDPSDDMVGRDTTDGSDSNTLETPPEFSDETVETDNVVDLSSSFRVSGVFMMKCRWLFSWIDW
mmetsp:Transcript_15555/g.35685  ORF Transcript_15555/g.35685 Transcript_15555/m.35685 type:complete len:93 (+) Transcript_15555:73-351(+)